MIWEVTFMNKEEILAKSRQENQDRDIAEIENSKSAAKFALISAVIYAGIIFLIEALITDHMNYSLWSVLAFVNFTISICKAVKFKSVRHRPAAILWGTTTFIVIMLAIIDIMDRSVL